MCSKIDSSTKIPSQNAVKCDDNGMPSGTPNGNDILARKKFFEHLLAMEKLTTTKENTRHMQDSFPACDYDCGVKTHSGQSGSAVVPK